MSWSILNQICNEFFKDHDDSERYIFNYLFRCYTIVSQNIITIRA